MFLTQPPAKAILLRQALSKEGARIAATRNRFNEFSGLETQNGFSFSDLQKARASSTIERVENKDGVTLADIVAALPGLEKRSRWLRGDEKEVEAEFRRIRRTLRDVGPRSWEYRDSLTLRTAPEPLWFGISVMC